jgi:ankyrin repeat protein
MEANRRMGKKCAGIHHCASQGKLQLVELHILADQSALNTRTKNYSSVLMRADSRVDSRVVKQLIEWRVDSEAKDSLGCTAMHIAALRGDHAKIRMLIEARADVNAKTK